MKFYNNFKLILFLILPLLMLKAGVAVSEEEFADEYEDTEFGIYLYSEASDETKEEMIDLLEDQNPAVAVFAHAVSMGLGIDEVLEAAVRRDSDNSRDYVTAAASLLPFLGDTYRYRYGEYELDDLEEPYKIEEVAKRFFEDDEILIPQPDWRQNQYHFYGLRCGVKGIK